jgi:hypothetical protein
MLSDQQTLAIGDLTWEGWRRQRQAASGLSVLRRDENLCYKSCAKNAYPENATPASVHSTIFEAHAAVVIVTRGHYGSDQTQYPRNERRRVGAGRSAARDC